jgi:hypothetical protein
MAGCVLTVIEETPCPNATQSGRSTCPRVERCYSATDAWLEQEYPNDGDDPRDSHISLDTGNIPGRRRCLKENCGLDCSLQALSATEEDDPGGEKRHRCKNYPFIHTPAAFLLRTNSYRRDAVSECNPKRTFNVAIQPPPQAVGRY